jgi:hypothetical protein
MLSLCSSYFFATQPLNGHADLLPKGLLEPTLYSNRMEPYSVPLVILYAFMSADLSATALYVLSMVFGASIVALVLFAHRAWSLSRPANPGK